MAFTSPARICEPFVGRKISFPRRNAFAADHHRPQTQGRRAWPLGHLFEPGFYDTKITCSPASGGREQHRVRVFQARGKIVYPQDRARAQAAAEAMLKNLLRDILTPDNSRESEAWFECLILREEKNRLRVIFPHAYFAAWFARHKRALFEEALKRHFGDTPLPEIVYEQALRKSAFLLPVEAASPAAPLPEPKCDKAPLTTFCGRLIRAQRKNRISAPSSATAKTPFLWLWPEK